MSTPTEKRAGAAAQAARELRAAVDAEKCHRCGCFHGALEQIRKSLVTLPAEAQDELCPVLDAGAERVLGQEYDCLGCAICWPANALNVAAEGFPEATFDEGAACPADLPKPGLGWPSLPGEYRVLDSSGHVAVCVLTSQELMESVAAARRVGVAIVGTLYTENLGIERMITNVLANPNITTLVLAGADSRQRIGHRPGQSLLSLVANGLDDRGRIIEAMGRRPLLKNVTRDTVEAFRREIHVVDRLGEEEPSAVLDAIAEAPAESRPHRTVPRPSPGPDLIAAETPTRLVLDPSGYFIVFPDRRQQRIVLEHYENGGMLAHVFQGDRAEDLCSTVISRGLVSRLDHAAYLGKELARAEWALRKGGPYVQDAAPEPPPSCGPGCC